MNGKAKTDAGREDALRTDRAYHHGNLRAAAITAALEALTQKMPSQISLRDLAKAVGVRHSALYVHFRDRDELFAVVAGEGFRKLGKEQTEALANADGDKVATLSKTYLRFARANPAHYRVMFSSTNMTPENYGHVEAFCNATFTMLIEAIAEAGGVSDEEAEHRALGIWCALHGLVQLGGSSGVLHQRVAPEEEEILATEFTHAFTRHA